VEAMHIKVVDALKAQLQATVREYPIVLVHP
jgi:hypothetical protein